MDLSNRFIGAMTEAPGDVDPHYQIRRELVIERAENDRLRERLALCIFTIDRQQRDILNLRRGKRERVRPQI